MLRALATRRLAAPRACLPVASLLPALAAFLPSMPAGAQPWQQAAIMVGDGDSAGAIRDLAKPS
ncbi:MAG: hypothetical protein PSV46_17840 [Reyranella sp.]|nr:hypothetical protein [Reyranella sp.]